MKRTQILIKDWENVSISYRRTEKATTAAQAVARFAAQCALDKELRSETYWQEFIDNSKRLGTISQQVADYRQQVEELAQRGDHRTAVRIPFHALATDPSDAASYSKIAVMYYAMGEHSKAVKAYKRAAKLHLSDAECQYKLGMAYLLGDDPCPAAIAFARAIKLKPDYSEAYDQLALIYRKYGYHDSAIEVLTRRLEVCDDQTGSVYGALARSLIYRERYEEAIAAYRRDSKIAPDNADWHYDEGEALLEVGRYEEAIRAYLKAFELAPHNVNPLISIACAYDRMGKPEQGDKVIERMSLILGGDYNSLKSLTNEIERGLICTGS